MQNGRPAEILNLASSRAVVSAMGDGSLRHVVHKRVHLERHQPKHRRRLGYLEKHKDYVKRAKDFHKKEDIIKGLHRKAYFKNEDEFAYGMMSHSTMKDGKKLKKKGHLSQMTGEKVARSSREYDFSRSCHGSMRSELSRASRNPHRSSPEIFEFNLELAAARRSWVKSWQLLQQAKKARLQPDAVTYATAADSLATAKRATDAGLLLQQARTRQIKPTTALNTAVVNAYAGQSCWEETSILVDNMRRQGPKPNVVTCSVALKSCAASRWARWADALLLLRTAWHQFAVDSVCLGATVAACAVSSAWEQGLSVLMQSIRLKLRANIIMYSSIVTSCEHAGEWEVALRILEVPTVQAAPNVVPLSSAVSTFEKRCRWSQALQLLCEVPLRSLQENTVCPAGQPNSFELIPVAGPLWLPRGLKQ
ncbi:putative U3 small nucleolar RNA-associated protein 11 [Symbiodinium microadriaticum]|uniref:Putative U3 small nucleolar RNA-associated protein 11 n=1 Tax=Symbiodinium microadriaticum TaxID=2951 RepID=A0A1Q9CGM4_SYMMI|nr:putative U3 small nucleolar RNA-associated protein 11 [Symbiodinium microadriaticum]CAE7892140.1 UTP11 [Symbiodinium microadriaticum]